MFTIMYEGDTPDCLVGAWNLWQKHSGGDIFYLVLSEGPHFYYFPPNSTEDTPAMNLGLLEDGRTYFLPLTKLQVLERGGDDWTDQMRDRFSTSNDVCPLDERSVIDL